MAYRRIVLAWLAAALVAGSLSGCATMADRQDDALKISALNKKWLGLVVRKDAAAISELYAADGSIMPPNAPIATGRKAIAETWAGFFKLPSLTLNFRTTELVISRSGDLASDRGTYDLAFDGDKGRVREIGKYVVVWKKVGGQWQVLADIFNSDKAM